MIINFVGNFQIGYVGEEADQVHIAREMEELGHIVRKIPQDEWKEYVLTGKSFPNVPSNLNADINIITKWHHFDSGSYIDELKVGSGAPVLYWVWDYMEDNGNMPLWHMEMAGTADLYLSNDVRNPTYKDFPIKSYYFPFDVADQEIPLFDKKEKIYDVVFFGSYINQGDRIEWLKEINKQRKVEIFSWNYQEWIKEGFTAYPAVYGLNFNETVAKSKIILGFSVEPSCWGYWSNRVGKVLLAKGFLLYQYAPGMELFLRDGVEYFSTIPQAIKKIDYYIENEREREQIALRGYEISQERFSSKARVADLMILIEQYLETKGKNWKI